MRTAPGELLGGRLRYAQPVDGYRTGIEPVLLAAAVPARAGQRVLEGGTGAGAGLMCLAARVPGVAGMGVEIDPAMAALARDNLAANGIVGIEVLTGDVTSLTAAGFDHAFANPPWHEAGSTPSPLPRRRLAKQAEPGGLQQWVAALAGSVRPCGTVTLILRADAVGPAAEALSAAGMAGTSTMWLLPKVGRPPKLALLSAGTDAPPREVSLVLHEADGRYTPQVEAVLRAGAGLFG